MVCKCVTRRYYPKSISESYYIFLGCNVLTDAFLQLDGFPRKELIMTDSILPIPFSLN